MRTKMFKKRFFTRLLTCAVPLAAGVAVWCLTGMSAPAPLPEQQKLELIAKLSSRLLERNHYRQQPLNEDISSKAFDSLFKNLDPNRMYFRVADLEEFDPVRKLLGKQLLAGDISFAGKVYARYLQRFDEYRNFAGKVLAEPMDFSTDETIEPDRRDASWFVTEAEQQDFWRRKLKNDVLYFRLMRKAMEMDVENAKAKETENTATEESPAVSEPDKKAIRALWDTKTPEEKIQRRLADIGKELHERDAYDILAVMLTSLANAYGPHSDYSSEKSDAEFDIGMSLSLTGIGATLSSDDGYTRVVELVLGGPAALDGRLQPEDRIIAVAQADGEPVDVIDMTLNNVVKLIRGPEGTKVTLTILPGRLGRNAVPESLTLTRAKVELKESEVKGNIQEVERPAGEKVRVGVIDFNRFYVDFEAIGRGNPDYKSSARDMRKVLERFKQDGVDAIVVDLRFNGGGGLTEAINMSGLFIKDGPIVQVRHSDRRVNPERDPDEEIVYDGPLVVLTSKMTASAAEIFASAMRDYQRGILVGDTRTFGKGTVIDVVKLESLLRRVNQSFPAGSLRYETAEFYGVDGDSNQQLGIKPDIVLPSMTEEMEIGELFSDNHLPWDQIEGVEHDTYNANIAAHRRELARRSAARVPETPGYQQLLRSIDLFKQYRDRKTISLNETTRWNEYLEERKAREAEEKLLPAASRLDAEKSSKDDPVLEEAKQIAADYAELLKDVVIAQSQP